MRIVEEKVKPSRMEDNQAEWKTTAPHTGDSGGSTQKRELRCKM
jgi:hypothetical protein